MSEFIEFFTGETDTNVSLEDWQNEFKDMVVTRGGWQVLHEEPGILDVIPPETEPIGNNEYFDYLRVKFTPEMMEFLPCLYATENAPQLTHIVEISFYSNQSHRTVTYLLNGFSFTSPGNSNQSVSEKRDEYINIISDNSEFMEDVESITPNGDDSLRIEMKYPNLMTVEVTTSSNYSTQRRIQDLHLAPSPNSSSLDGRGLTLPINLITGIMYFINVYSRTITVALKDLNGYHGPVCASYTDNEYANFVTPPDCAPVELAVVDLSTATAYNNVTVPRFGQPSNRTQSRVLFSHYNSVLFTGRRISTPGPMWSKDLINNSVSDVGDSHQDKRKFSIAGAQSDLTSDTQNRAVGIIVPFVTGLGIRYDSTTPPQIRDHYFGGSFGIQPIVIQREAGSYYEGNSNSGENFQAYLSPLYVELPDAFFQVDDDTSSESLSLSVTGITSPAIEILSDSLEIEDATLFPDAGTILLDGEVILYGEKTGNILSNLTRGYMIADDDGDQVVKLCEWFIKINHGAIYIGYNLPEVLSV